MTIKTVSPYHIYFMRIALYIGGFFLPDLIKIHLIKMFSTSKYIIETTSFGHYSKTFRINTTQLFYQTYKTYIHKFCESFGIKFCDILVPEAARITSISGWIFSYYSLNSLSWNCSFKKSWNSLITFYPF